MLVARNNYLKFYLTSQFFWIRYRICILKISCLGCSMKNTFTTSQFAEITTMVSWSALLADNSRPTIKRKCGWKMNNDYHKNLKTHIFQSVKIEIFYFSKFSIHSENIKLHKIIIKIRVIRWSTHKKSTRWPNKNSWKIPVIQKETSTLDNVHSTGFMCTSADIIWKEILSCQVIIFRYFIV